MKTQTLRILVVDDHHDTVEACQRILVRHGHRVTTAESFDEAISLAKLERFELLLCDIGMPDHDGFDLLLKLKTLYPVRAIALSGYGMPDDVERVAKAGFDSFLLKPVDFVRLQAAIANVATAIEIDRNRDEQVPQPLAAVHSPV